MKQEVKIKIAIVDDHEIIRSAVSEILQYYGFEVIIVGENGKSIIDKIEKSTVFPDVCIVDAIMPIMDGIQTISKLKAKWPMIKIIGYSLDVRDGEKMLRKGADKYLLKTSAPDKLKDLIKELVEIQS